MTGNLYLATHRPKMRSQCVSTSSHSNTFIASNGKSLVSAKALGPHEFRNSLLFLEAIGRKQYTTFSFKGKNVQIKGSKHTSGTSVRGSVRGKTVVILPPGEILRTDRFGERHIRMHSDINARSNLNLSLLENTFYFSSDLPSTVATIDALGNGAMASLGIQSGIKYSSGFGAFTGCMIMQEAHLSLMISTMIGDVAGRELDLIRLIRGSIETLTGIVFIAYRTVCIIAAKTAVKVAVIWSAILGIAATVAGSGVYALLALPCAIKGIHSFGLLTALKNAKGPVSGQKLLIDQLELKKEHYQKAEKKMAFGSEAALYHMLKDSVTLSEKEEAALSFEDKEHIAESVNRRMAEVSEDFMQLGDRGHVKDHLMIRMAKEVARMKLVKEAALLRKCGSGTLQKLRTIMRQDPGDRVYDVDLLPMAIEEARFNTIMNGYMVVTCIIGILGVVGCSVFTGGIPLTISLVMMLLCNVLMIGVDGYCFISDVKNAKKRSTGDKMLLATLSILSVLCTAIGAYFSGGLVPLIVILLVGVAMLTVAAIGAFTPEDKTTARDRK